MRKRDALLMTCLSCKFFFSSLLWFIWYTRIGYYINRAMPCWKERVQEMCQQWTRTINLYFKKKGEETRKRLQASNEWALALTQKLTLCFHRGICAIRSTFDGLLCAYEFRGPCMIVCCVVVWACKDCSLSERSLSISFPMCSGWHARNW